MRREAGLVQALSTPKEGCAQPVAALHWSLPTERGRPARQRASYSPE